MVRFHVDAKANKFHPLGLKAEALFESMFAGQENLPARADHALPWHASPAAVESPSHLAGVAGKSSGVGDVAIRGNFSAWDAADLGEEKAEEIPVGLWRHAQQVATPRATSPSVNATASACYNERFHSHTGCYLKREADFCLHASLVSIVYSYLAGGTR